MSMQKEQLRFLEKALRRMFRDVGQKYTREVVGEPEWFYEHTLTMAKQRKFQAWFAAQGAKDLGWPKRYARKQAGWFVLFHGWRVNSAGWSIEPRAEKDSTENKMTSQLQKSAKVRV